MKHDALAVSREEFAEIRNVLDAPYKFHLVARDEQRILFLRTAHPDPDPVSDLEACLERVPDAAIREVQHIVLVGTNGNLHLPASVARPLLERRDAFDRAAVGHLRATLRPDYGVALQRVAGDPGGLVRLGLRVPRLRCLDLSDQDLRALAVSLGPLLEDQSAQTAVVGYIVADQDHVRLLAEELLLDLAPRWEEIKRQQAASPPPPPPPVVQPPAPAPAEPGQPKAQAPRRPKRTIRVKPVVDLEFRLDATPPEVDYDPTLLDAATRHVDELLSGRGFEIMRNVSHGTEHFTLAAERQVGYPRRILVRTLGRFGRVDAADSLRLVRELDADLLLVINEHPEDDALRRTIGTKVKVLTPSEVRELRI